VRRFQGHAGENEELVPGEFLSRICRHADLHKINKGEKTMTFELIDTYTENAVIKVIGVGGGGGNALEHMVVNQIEGVDFICANTDAQALRRSSATIQLQLGTDITKGLGAG